MEAKHLHIVMHEVPYPADFGGVVDLFHKLVWLHKNDVKIHLHCFVHKRPAQDKLLEYCTSVTYYKRKIGLSGFSFRLPYIVSSRISRELIDNLSKDNYPILIEGVHCAYPLYIDALKGRTVILRLHNVEFEYYRHLAKFEHNPFKKIYFNLESKLLRRFESNIASKAAIACVSEHDEKVYRQTFGSKDICFIPVFTPFSEVTAAEGKGCYCLYHGNLSVNENEKACEWLLKNVFKNCDRHFVIAGKNPSKRLEKLAHAQLNTCIVANPSDKEMQDMIAKAHIHILPSMNNTGVKLKLLNALYSGKHCIVNQAGVAGSGLESLCHTAEKPADYCTIIKLLYEQPFTQACIDERNALLKSLYSNENNAKAFMKLIWQD